jgi:hypothetical protein
MSPSVLPWFEEADYPRFQRMIPELQNDSYSEWIDEHTRAVAYRRTRNGSRDISISPDEFDEWLKTTKQAAHLELLWVYAEYKAARLPQPT